MIHWSKYHRNASSQCFYGLYAYEPLARVMLETEWPSVFEKKLLQPQSLS